MTEREREILGLIKANPMISQNELASILKITRSSVSVHISNLMKKGYIRGKGYVTSDVVDDIVVIGGANMDISGHLVMDYQNDSNPGDIHMASGGVGRNIAENLARLGCHVFLVTALGDDLYGQRILEDCKSCGIDMSLTKMYSDYKTSVYMEMLNHSGELELAISDMKIMDQLKIEDMEAIKNQLNRAKAVVVDGNVSESVIEFLATHYGSKLYFETVSKAKAGKIKPYLSKVHCITPNLVESNFLLDSDASKEELMKDFLDIGVMNPIITLGKDGVMYFDKEIKVASSKANFVESVTGAGDALMAGLVYGYVNDMSLEDQIDFSLRMACETLKTTKAVHHNIKELMKI